MFAWLPAKQLFDPILPRGIAPVPDGLPWPYCRQTDRQAGRMLLCCPCHQSYMKQPQLVANACHTVCLVSTWQRHAFSMCSGMKEMKKLHWAAKNTVLLTSSPPASQLASEPTQCPSTHNTFFTAEKNPGRSAWAASSLSAEVTATTCPFSRIAASASATPHMIGKRIGNPHQKCASCAAHTGGLYYVPHHTNPVTPNCGYLFHQNELILIIYVLFVNLAGLGDAALHERHDRTEDTDTFGPARRPPPGTSTHPQTGGSPSCWCPESPPAAPASLRH
jgi:hypothetical protein